MTTAGDGLDLYEDLLVDTGEGGGHFRAEAEEVLLFPESLARRRITIVLTHYITQLRGHLKNKTAEVQQLQQALEAAQTEVFWQGRHLYSCCACNIDIKHAASCRILGLSKSERYWSGTFPASSRQLSLSFNERTIS